MDQAEASGKTVEDALNAALRKVGARREEVEFTVLDEGKRGGLFGRGAKDALVRVTRLAPQDRVAGPSGPPDTRIPRQGQRGGGAGAGQRGRDGGQRPPRGAGGAERGQRAGAGRSTGFEQAQPKLTDADFVRGSVGRPTGLPAREGAPRRGRPRTTPPSTATRRRGTPGAPPRRPRPTPRRGRA